MDPVLNRHREKIKRAYRALIDVDGYTAAMLADVMRYRDPGMVYQITNAHTTALPPLERHQHAACQLSDDGNTRLSKLSVCGRYALFIPEPVTVNGSVTDERSEMHRSTVEIEQALEAGDTPRAERLIDQMQSIVDRCRAEVAQVKGEKINHQRN